MDRHDFKKKSSTEKIISRCPWEAKSSVPISQCCAALMSCDVGTAHFSGERMASMGLDGMRQGHEELSCLGGSAAFSV